MVTGDDKEQVSKSAEYLASSFWEVRDDFDFVAPTATLEESLALGFKSAKKPFIISDMGIIQLLGVPGMLHGHFVNSWHERNFRRLMGRW